MQVFNMVIGKMVGWVLWVSPVGIASLISMSIVKACDLYQVPSIFHNTPPPLPRLFIMLNGSPFGRTQPIQNISISMLERSFAGHCREGHWLTSLADITVWTQSDQKLPSRSCVQYSMLTKGSGREM